MLTAELIANQLAPAGKRATRGTEGNWNTWCPCHEDSDSSFSVKVNEHGYPVPYCHRGCNYDLLKDELKRRNLWPEPKNSRDNVVSHSKQPKSWTWIADWDYQDAHGKVVYRTCKFLKPDGHKTFVQKRRLPNGSFEKGLGDVQLIIYNYPKVLEAGREGEPIFLQEGEKDCDTLTRWSEGALYSSCSPLGASQSKENPKWKEDYTQQLVLAGIQRVYIIPDHDVAGENHAIAAALSCFKSGLEVYIVRLPNSREKGDLTDWKEDGHTFDEFVDLVADAKPWEPEPIITDEEEQQTAGYQKCLNELGLGPAPDRDRANGRRFARLHKDKCRYTKEARWLFYFNGRYEPDTKKETQAMAFAKDAVDSIFDEADRYKKRCYGLSKRLKEWAHSSQQSRRIRDTLVMASSEPELKASCTQFDTNPYWVNCLNGIVDVRNVTPTLIEHSPEHLLMKQIPIEFDINAKCPTWEEFIDHMTQGDAVLAWFLQKAAGYSATGITKEQMLFVIEGPGENGKSLFLDTLQDILGDYADNVDARMFMRKRQENQLNSVTQLFGKRFINISEINEGEHLDEARVKDVSGGTDKMKGRYLFDEPISFKPQCKLWFRGNYRPAITGTDDGIWRRICLIPLEANLKAIYKTKYLEEKFIEERAGILNWILKGAFVWAEDGLKPYPDVVEEAIADYRAEQDTIGMFIAECMEAFPGLSTPATKIYAAYKLWALAHGHSPLSQKRLGTVLNKRFDKHKAHGYFVYDNVILREASN